MIMREKEKGKEDMKARLFIGRYEWFVICLVFLLSAGGVVCAQEDAKQPLRLSVGDAVERALKNNLSLETARAAAATKERASKYSWNQFIPGITLGGSLILDNKAAKVSGLYPVDLASVLPTLPLPPGTLYGVAPYSVEASQWHIAGSIQASLSISMAMFENMNRLKLDYEGGLIAYDKAKLQLERDVRKAYNNMLLLQENIGLLRVSYENVERQVQMARANYNAGLVPEISLLQAQVALENMKPTMDQVENGLRLSMAYFAMFLGLPYDTLFEFNPVQEDTVFVSLDVSDLISQAARNKPDIQELRHTILMLQSARKAQTLALLPALSLSWNATPVIIDPKADWGASTNMQKSGGLTISLGVRLHSLIPYSPDFQGIKNMDDQINTVSLGLSQMIQGTEIEIYNTVLSLERTRRNMDAQAKTVDLAERSYRLTEQAYRAGLQDHLQVQNAEQSLRQARVQMYEQQFTYLNSLIDLEYSIGVPFGTLVSERTLSSKEKK